MIIDSLHSTLIYFVSNCFNDNSPLPGCVWPQHPRGRARVTAKPSQGGRGRTEGSERRTLKTGTLLQKQGKVREMQ